MKQSKFHYFFDIVLFGVIPPLASILLFTKTIENKILIIDNTVLGEFIKDFTVIKIQNISIISFICLLFFGPIRYCLNIGLQRKLFTKENYKNYSKITVSMGISTWLILTATLVLSELQLSILTGWIAFIVLVFSFFKLSVYSDNHEMTDQNDNK